MREDEYSPQDRQRLARVRRNRKTHKAKDGKSRSQVRRNRNNPAQVPARLVRTSAFAPRRTHLSSDADFERIYIVPGHSVIRVKGRELGSQHRDLIYNIFRVGKRCAVDTVVPDPEGPLPFRRIRQVPTTWRDLILAAGKTEHVNNVMSMHEIMSEFSQVLFDIYEGDQKQIAEAIRARDWQKLRELSPSGSMRHLFETIEWEGLDLDSKVVITYGDWTIDMIEMGKLVSLNSDVQNGLRSDYAKSIWPYIDSMTTHTYVDEPMLESLLGRDIWSDDETKTTRGQFRKDTKQAFEDMVRAGGLKSFRMEWHGKGHRKWKRYHYEPGLTQQTHQLELNM